MLSFPALGIELNINRVAFSLFGLDIYWYGIMIALAYFLGYVFFTKNIEKAGIPIAKAEQVLFFATIGGVVGARLYFVIFQWDTLYKDNPMDIFAIRDGGLAIYGGIIGALLVGAIVARYKKLPVLPMLDVAMPAILLGQGIGRWGNFFNIEAFGGNTTLPWGMTSPVITNYLSSPNIKAELALLGQTVDPNMPVHPTFFYEFVWNLLGFFVLYKFVFKNRKFDGECALGYVVWYGMVRLVIEGLRTDSLLLTVGDVTVRVSQILSIVGCIAAVITIIVVRQRLKNSTYTMYVDTEASREAIKNTSVKNS